MKELSRKDRLIANEVIFRDVNTNIQEFIEEEGRTGQPIPFYCECSSPTCLERINLTPQQYKTLHKSKKIFVIKPRHEFLEVEKVVNKTSDYEVVEKHFQPPKPKDIELALKTINSTLSAS